LDLNYGGEQIQLYYLNTLKNRKISLTGIFHEDIDKQNNTVSSFAIPQPKTRRFTLHVNRKFENLGIDLGGIWAGQPLNGRDYQVMRGKKGIIRYMKTK